MNITPFYFEELSSGKVLITNELGIFEILDSRAELEMLIDAPEGFKNERRRRLEYKKFIVSSDGELETVAQLMMSKYASTHLVSIRKPSLFIVVPTLRCDHNCTYCQVSRAAENAAGYDLDLNHIQHILDHISRYDSSSPKIEFQGGEPALVEPFIISFIEQALEVFDDPSFVITTSLSKLSESFLRFSVDKKIDFSISLDGTEDYHNYNRKHVIYSSHSRVVIGVSAIRELLGPSRVSPVTTVTAKTIGNPNDIIRAHLQLGFSTLFVRPLSPFGFATKKFSKQYSAAEFVAYYRELLLRLLANYDEYRLKEQTAIIHLRRIYRCLDSGYVDLKSPAGYFFGALVFNYDGGVYGSDEARMIAEATKDKTLSLCDVSDDQPTHTSTVEILARSFISENPGCDTCAYRIYCGSDPMHHLSTQQDVVGDKSLSYFCEVQKGVFNTLFECIANPAYFKIFEEWLDD